MTIMPYEEKRAAVRAKARCPVTMNAALPNGLRTLIHATTDDISSSAFRCVSDQPLAVFTRVDVTINLPVEESEGSTGLSRVECEGVVVRQEEVRKADGEMVFLVAIFLDHTTVEQRRALDQLVEQSLMAEPSAPDTA